MSKLTEALRSGKQADEDGVMCVVSRQACYEAAEMIERAASLAEAVRSSDSGIVCDDVKGKNWFDLRDEIFESA